MGFIALKCPSCGAEIELDESRDFAFCTYCGTKMVRDKQIIEHRGSIKVEGIATANALLERAYNFIADKDFHRAVVYLNRVLDQEPKCAKAYWGLLLCQFATNETILDLLLDRPLTEYDLYNKAVMFAEDEDKAYYESINLKLVDRLNKEDEAAKNARKPYFLSSLLLVAIICVQLFFLTGVICGVFACVIFIVILAVPEFFVVKKLIKASRAIKIVKLRKQRLKLR